MKKHIKGFALAAAAVFGLAACGGSSLRLATALLAVALPVLLGGCATGPAEGVGTARVYTASAPSEDERYCAWFGDVEGDVLYFGESAFWSAYRAGSVSTTAATCSCSTRTATRSSIVKNRRTLRAGLRQCCRR